MTVDSGSAVTNFPAAVARDYPSKPTAYSKTGWGYVAANGSHIADEGEKTLMRRESESDLFRPMRARVGDVIHGLMSVADLVDAGHRVVFGDEKECSYAEHKKTGVRMWFARRVKTYRPDFEVIPYAETEPCSGPASRS